MKITLIRPNMGDFRSFDALKPIAIGILANIATDKGHTVEFFDDRIETIPENLNTDLIAITVETFTAKRAYNIATKFLKKGHKVVLGGVHVTLLPEEAKEFATTIAIGDAEDIWPIILDDLQNNQLKESYVSKNSLIYDKPINQSIFKGKKYGPVELIQFNRGCKFICEFCSINATYGRNIRARSIDSIIKELLTFDNNKTIFFIDDNLFNNKENLINLLNAITPLKKKFATQISIDVARDDFILKKLKEAGFIFLLIGFESLSKQNLKQMKKNWNHVSGPYNEVINRIHEHKIGVYGTFVFGYDYDNLEIVSDTLKFAMDSKLEIINLNPLTPTPKTGLYERLKLENRLINEKWWLTDYKYGDPIYLNKNYNENEMVDLIQHSKCKFYSFYSIISRLFFRRNKLSTSVLKLSLIANIISAIELRNKIKRKIG